MFHSAISIDLMCDKNQFNQNDEPIMCERDMSGKGQKHANIVNYYSVIRTQNYIISHSRSNRIIPALIKSSPQKLTQCSYNSKYHAIIAQTTRFPNILHYETNASNAFRWSFYSIFQTVQLMENEYCVML